MTQERAIRVLKDDLRVSYRDEKREALGMAIEALQQPQIVRCKDCKWGEPAMNGKGEEMVFCYCGDTGIEDGWLLNPDWYCAEGEEPKDD